MASDNGCFDHPQDHRHLFRLTTLQIGDMQSYVSRLFLLITCEASKLVFLVDNGPWTIKKRRSKPAELWQLMVTQSRASPFANHRLRYPQDEHGCEKEKNKVQDIFMKEIKDASIFSRETWCRILQDEQHYIRKPLHDALQGHLKSLVRVKELSNLLHGCVAFELSWENVRGINYLNELQTDTCVALEAKLVTKRDFDSLQQALAFYDCKHDDARHTVLASYGKANDSSLEVCSNLQKDQVARSSSYLFPNSILTKRGRCNGSNKLKGKNSIGPVENRTCSSLEGDISESCWLKRRRVCSTSKCRGFKYIGSCDHNNATRTPTESEMHEMTWKNNKCHQHSIETNECCYHSNEAWNLSGDYYCHEDIKKPEQWSGGGDWGMGRSSSEEQDMNDVVIRDDCIQLDFISHIYRDILILFRFCDPILPFELKKIITVDQRLLKLLETGLPSWAIFLQSYPVFCNIYRPWMWPLANTMYFLISVATVIIGFYDLYKNVPILKATAARLCGPLFEWIEAWEMVSRLKYLGTMLFLQNYEKAFKWLLMIMKTVKHLFSILMWPMVEPLSELREILSPVWNVLAENILGIGILFQTVFSYLLVIIDILLQLVIWPFFVLLESLWSLVTLLLYPVMSALWAIIILPLQICMQVVNLLVIIFCALFKIILNIWEIFDHTTELISASELIAASEVPVVTSLKVVKSSTQVSPLWWTLPNELFSKVFRAVRSIVNGLVAFFAACNRHRLSIYNHFAAFLLQLGNLLRSAHSVLSTAYEQIYDMPILNNDDLYDEVFPFCAGLDSSALSIGEEDDEEEGNKVSKGH